MIQLPAGLTAFKLFKLLPWALVGVMALGLWGAYGYVTAAREARAVAESERDRAVASKEAAETKAREDQALLAAREVQLASSNKAVRERDAIIRGFKPNENCLTFDTPMLDLDRMLSDGPALPASAGS